jgi:hypothetical protein
LRQGGIFQETPMTFLLVLLIGGFVLATGVALVRGLMAFFRDGEQIRLRGHGASEAYGVKQMMAQRVLFQGIAIVLVALIGALASQN